MSPQTTQLRSGNDLQHSGLSGYRIVPKQIGPRQMELDSRTVQIQTAGEQPANMSENWNQRMDQLGARRGTWDELQALLPH